jgi:hypothetical protein
MKQMMHNAKGPMQSMAFAFGGAVMAAIVTMFVPIGLMESIIGTTGISEMFPAMAAPLGDTARALIAFTVGVLAFAVLALLLSKKGETVVKTAKPDHQEDDRVSFGLERFNGEAPQEKGPSFFDNLREKFGQLRHSGRGESDDDFADLPKLRSRDAHPDAPARPPISAHRDFGEPGVIPAPLVQPAVEQAIAEPEPAPIPEPAAAPVVEADATPKDTSPANLADIVSNLEMALLRRQEELHKLEDIARRVMAQSVAGQELETTAIETPVVVEDAAPARRLEAVTPSGGGMTQRPRGGDEALRSALETLHRMNARSR